jgi:hypothetical protein
MNFSGLNNVFWIATPVFTSFRLARNDNQPFVIATLSTAKGKQSSSFRSAFRVKKNNVL